MFYYVLIFIHITQDFENMIIPTNLVNVLYMSHEQ